MTFRLPENPSKVGTIMETHQINYAIDSIGGANVLSFDFVLTDIQVFLGKSGIEPGITLVSRD